MIRPSVSAAPPAANGAMILTGLFGHACAFALGVHGMQIGGQS
jgi:hypothetical protein